jgi:hypothetical protein
MPLPIAAATALKFAPLAISAIGSLFKKKPTQYNTQLNPQGQQMQNDLYAGVQNLRNRPQASASMPRSSFDAQALLRNTLLPNARKINYQGAPIQQGTMSGSTMPGQMPQAQPQMNPQMIQALMRARQGQVQNPWGGQVQGGVPGVGPDGAWGSNGTMPNATPPWMVQR